MTTTKIEKLTDEERAWLEGSSDAQGLGPGACAKGLRIIDQLTAALEAAEHEVDEGKTFAAETGLEIGGLRRELKLVSALRDSFAAGMASAESRAEALQARVAELEVTESQLLAGNASLMRRIDELTPLQARVAELEAQLSGLTAALEAAEHTEKYLRRYYDRQLAHVCDDRTTAESLAQALQARVAELEASVAAYDSAESRMSGELSDALEALRAAESELADLRGRVERATEHLDQFGAGMPRPARLALEALRGR